MVGFGTLKQQQLAQCPPKTSIHPELQNISAPHIQSFDSLFSNDALLQKAILDIPKTTVFDNMELPISQRNKIEFWVANATVAKPMMTKLIYPAECRERGVSYKATMQIKLCWRVNDGPVIEEVRGLGSLPVMVRVSFFSSVIYISHLQISC